MAVVLPSIQYTYRNCPPSPRVSQILLWTIIVILFLAVIGLIVYSAFLGTQRINPQQCPKALGTFGVQTSRTAVTLNRCATGRSGLQAVAPGMVLPVNAGNATNAQSGSSPCVFAVTDLASAINQCDSLANICSAFAYTNGSMRIIDPATITTGTEDLYLRQIGAVVIPPSLAFAPPTSTNVPSSGLTFISPTTAPLITAPAVIPQGGTPISAFVPQVVASTSAITPTTTIVSPTQTVVSTTSAVVSTTPTATFATPKTP